MRAARNQTLAEAFAEVRERCAEFRTLLLREIAKTLSPVLDWLTPYAFTLDRFLLRSRMRYRARSVPMRVKILYRLGCVLEALVGYCGGCLRCGRRWGCHIYPARSQYVRQDGSLDERKNVPVWLCPVCFEEYTEYWDELWQEYYTGLL